ncbi:deoxycytidylate deaminase [Mycobacterium sp. 050134]|uniref:deoxycytidylate deaminase n=1 Tax=Mycobacterium sp. 050134 TaxID=3096111 RepID=UPI002ED83B73
MTIGVTAEDAHLREQITELIESTSDATDCVRIVTIDADLGVDSVHQQLFITDRDGIGLKRLADLVTLRRRITPSRGEYAMHAAYGAALRSAAMRGGVGAALADNNGEVVALGTAEVPTSGGGQYWDGDSTDARDIVYGVDPATTARNGTVTRLLELLSRMGTVLPSSPARTADVLLADFDSDQDSLGVGHGEALAQSFESLGRVVHAEMAAMLSAARSGIPVKGKSLYVTAQPCRQCLRHLVCAGLKRVVFLGRQLAKPPPFHADSISTTLDGSDRMLLLPFTGVGPGAYELLFAHQMRAAARIRR